VCQCGTHPNTRARLGGSGKASYLGSGPKPTRKRCRVLGRASWRGAERVEKKCGRSSSAIAGVAGAEVLSGAAVSSGSVRAVATGQRCPVTASQHGSQPGAVRFSFWQLSATTRHRRRPIAATAADRRPLHRQFSLSCPRAQHDAMLQPRICRFQPSRLGRSLLGARSYSQGFEQLIKPASFAPTASVDGGVLTAEGPRKDKFTPLRTYKPRTPGLRHLKRAVNDHLWKGRPFLKLTIARKGQHLGGRNNTGRVTVRHRGGGHKRRIRIVDYKRYLPGKHVVDRIEYDPNRSAHLALLTRLETGEKSYIVAADGMRAGDEVESYRTGIPKDLIASMGGTIDPGMLAAKTAARGNCLPIHMVPLGSQVFNVGSKEKGGGVFCRSAGTYAIIVNKEEVEKTKGMETKSVIIRMQSGEIRKVDPNACCTIGVASNIQKHFESLGKAGRSRWLGRRPEVRGLAMNAGQFPHASLKISITDIA
jgi:ribosomal protein L2